MKLKLTICAVLVAPLVFAQGEPTQKRFGDGTCLPEYLHQYDVKGAVDENGDDFSRIIYASPAPTMTFTAKGARVWVTPKLSD